MHGRKSPGISASGGSAHLVHIWGPIPGQCAGTREPEGATGLPCAATAPYCGPCIRLTAESSQQTLTQMVFCHVAPSAVSLLGHVSPNAHATAAVPGRGAVSSRG